MRTNEIVKTLRDLKEKSERKYKAEIEEISGSYARPEEREDSHLDALVSFKEKATLYDLVGLGQFLEDTFHCKVDIVSTCALREESKPFVLQDLVVL